MRVSSMPIVGKIPRPASDRPDQNFWPAAPTSGLATRVLLEDTSAISAAFHFHRANAFRSSTCSLEFHNRREERESVACSTNFTNFRDGGGSFESRFLHFRPANALVTSKSRIGTRQGRIGVEIGGGARVDLRVKFSRDGEDIFFKCLRYVVGFNRSESVSNSYVVWFVTDASNTSLNGSQSQRVLTMPARLR